MNGLATRIIRVGSGFGILLTLGWVLAGHAAGPIAPTQHGLPTDWTHRHVIFSQPATEAEVKRVGMDTRFWQQADRRNSVRQLVTEPEIPVLKLGTPAGSLAKMHPDWSESLGSGAMVTAGNFPAKYSFASTSANCAGSNPDFVVFSTSLLGSATQASIVAYDNIYSGCTGIVPATFWAYNTGGQILTSPVFSLDGKQVAFVETSGGSGILVLLKWAASSGTVGAPVSPANVPPASYATCSAPCMTQITLKDGGGVATDDTTSSVFVDYAHDAAWVGGAGGWLHKITPTFMSTPTAPPVEVTSGGFPVQLNGGVSPLSSPVFDPGSGNVFVADLGGFFYRVTLAGAVTASGRLDFGVGLVSGPIVDSTSGKIYLFASNNGTTNCTGGTGPCSSVYLFPTNFLAGSVETDVAVGGSITTPAPLYEGTFDNAYLTSVNATGRLFVCGNTGQRPIMYMININAGAFAGTVSGPALATGTASCSPVTDVYNPNTAGGPTEWVFAGPSTLGFGNNCNFDTAGCIISLKTTAWAPSTTYTVGQQILDPTFQIQTVRVAGTSKIGAHPAWSTVIDGNTVDGTVRWTNQGQSSPSHGFWFPTHAFTLGALIVDSNNNIQWVTTAGTSRTGLHPTWKIALNGNTADGSVVWKNIGPITTYSLSATGGISGVIMDNVATTGGASQVYFTTLSNQACGTSGTGGCAIQASQAALQ